MSVRLFVGNLAFGVTDAELKELFSAAGPVAQVRIPTDRETGQPRGFAFVDFADRPQAEEAIRRFDQFMFRDRALAVNEARARDASPAPGAARSPRPPPGAGTTRPRTAWTGPLLTDPDDDMGKPGQPRRTFGPDASSRDKRKQKGRSAKEERGPKGPIRERSGGQLFLGGDIEEDDEGFVDDFALWASEAEKTPDKE